MNAASPMCIIIAAILAGMTTIVSWRVFRAHSALNSPSISACVGGLVFAGLLTLPEGWQNAILCLYVSLSLAILFLLLWMAFHKLRLSRFLGNLSKMLEKQRYKARADHSRHNRAVVRRE
jgi:hypothetical protein